MIQYLQEKKKKKDKSERLSKKQVKDYLKKTKKAAIQTAKDGHSSFNADDASAPVIHVKDPRDLLKFGASAVKKQANAVRKSLSNQKTFEEFINQ